MINESELLQKFIKLLWVDDETLVNAENLNRLEDFIDILDQRTRTQVGDVIKSSVYEDMQQVINRYGGNYWILIDKPQGIYYEWLRSDVDPSTVKQISYTGMGVITVKGLFDESSIKETYGGNSWSQIAESGSFDIWRCTSHDISGEKIPSFEGMITFSFLPYNEFINKAEGEWKEVEGFCGDFGSGNVMHQYICTYNDASRVTGLGSYIGLISLSNNLDNEDKVKAKYDGTKYAETTWNNYISSVVKQWIRNA